MEIKKMKKFLATFICISVMFTLLSACTNKETTPTETPQEKAEQEVPSQEESTTNPDNYPVQLTGAQLTDFQNKLETMENYGFLLSDYDDIRNINLDQVLYSGAGMSNPSNSEDIINAYLDLAGKTEMYTGCVILTSEQIDDFLDTKTGYNLSSMNRALTWDYISEYDAYIVEHGDTNYCEICITNGIKTGENLYEVEYKINNGIYVNDESTIFGGTVTFKMDKQTLIFVSNDLYDMPDTFPEVVCPQ